MIPIIIAVFCLVATQARWVNPWTEHHLETLHTVQKQKEATGYKYPPEQWFVQELDHFNAQDQRTWKQRYFVNDSFYQPGGPIFFQVGGEGAISPGYVVDLMMVNYAQNEGALCVALEHRFYGTSLPLPDLSTGNLVYLTSEQALADAAYFIDYLSNEAYPESGPVITFGGSYPGNLASWFRLKYPHLTYGSIASSAPVQATLDMVQYLDVVEESLTDISGLSCGEHIQNATDIMQTMLQSTAGQQKLASLFQTCSPIKTPQDIATFMSNVMGNWMGVCQYNREIPGQPTVADLCAIMEGDGDVLQNYATVSNMFNAPGGCMQVSYADTVAQAKSIATTPTGVGGRQWLYQTCTEFGYFQSTDSNSQPFGDLVPVSYYTQFCTDVFGFTWEPRIDETNVMYGGADPQSTNVVFVNGSIDPWHALSILTSNPNFNITAIYIEGTAHCANMRKAKANDPPGLAVAQQQIAQILHAWVDEWTEANF